MKALILSFFILSTSLVFAAEGFEPCAPVHMNILMKADGTARAKLHSILAEESPNFSCEVEVKNHIFPAVCGRFNYTTYNFKIVNGANDITAEVQDGGISCSRFKSTKLAKVKFKKI